MVKGAGDLAEILVPQLIATHGGKRLKKERAKHSHHYLPLLTNPDARRRSLSF